MEITNNTGPDQQKETNIALRACRLCLNDIKDDASAINLFEEHLQQGNKKIPLTHRLYELFQIKYENTSALPNSVCSDCLFMVETFINFRESIKQCETALQRLFAQKMDSGGASSLNKSDVERPGLNDNPGVFEPEEGCNITVVDPEQEYESSDDDFSMESDTESEEHALLIPAPLHPQQQQKRNNHSEVSHNEPVGTAGTVPMDTSMSTHGTTVMASSSAETLGLEYVVKNTFLCQFCDMAFTNQPDCTEHETRHDPVTPYICNFCPQRATTRPILIYHIKEAHDAERPYVCTLCNKGFCRRSDLKKHTIVHTGVRPYTCSVCGKSFSRNTNLTKHMRIHSSVKPHVCQRCPRSFSTAGELMRHARSHAENKPFKCNRCPTSFTRKDKLQLHEQAHYRRESEFLNNQSKTVTANGSGGGAAAPLPTGQMENIVVALNPFGEQHENTNSDYRSGSILAAQLQQQQRLPKPISAPKQSHSRLFNCTICSKSFTRERDLQRHQALHLDTLFTCKQCGTGFSRREKLMRHEQEHHAPQYPCDICHITFGKRETLESHQKMHELQQKSVALSTQAAAVSAAIAAPASLVKDMTLPTQPPSAADMSFYSQMVPTMNLGFYSETRPEDRNNI